MSVPDRRIDELLPHVQVLLCAATPYLIALSVLGVAVWLWWTIRRAALVREALADRVQVEGCRPPPSIPAKAKSAAGPTSSAACISG